MAVDFERLKNDLSTLKTKWICEEMHYSYPTHQSKLEGKSPLSLEEVWGYSKMLHYTKDDIISVFFKD